MLSKFIKQKQAELIAFRKIQADRMFFKRTKFEFKPATKKISIARFLENTRSVLEAKLYPRRIIWLKCGLEENAIRQVNRQPVLWLKTEPFKTIAQPHGGF